ncbi:hypothetical protein OUZ56_015699 [Daphnia magna]|uniref:Uncharacterized protein n=1 Tax=Daphnia magna TaxID=35525 RepID=A0ABR0ANK9_9CRUS|nr:hypothetical protein OUZ56_015699 [Daphnia magna]
MALDVNVESRIPDLTHLLSVVDSVMMFKADQQAVLTGPTHVPLLRVNCHFLASPWKTIGTQTFMYTPCDKLCLFDITDRSRYVNQLGFQQRHG